jgi:hypothetical protein
MALEADASEPATHREADLEDEVAAVERIAQANRGLYTFARLTAAPLARMLFRPRVIGRSNVPKRGPVIIASNHLSFIDSVAIPMVAPRRVRFLAKSSYFDGTGASGRLRAASSSRARRSPSTPRARGRSTAGSTRGAPAPPGWRSPRAPRWCPSG